MITLEEVLNMSKVNGLKYITKYKGSDNEVVGVTVMEVPETCNWLNGNELVITSLYSIKDSVDKQVKLIKDLHNVNCSGLFVKLGPYVKKINYKVLNIAEELKIPIIIIPPFITYVEIIDSFMRAIVKSKEDNIAIENILYKLIIGEKINNNEYLEMERVFGISNIKQLYFYMFVDYNPTNKKPKDLKLNFYTIKVGNSRIYIYINKDKGMVLRNKNLINEYTKDNKQSIMISSGLKKGINNLEEDIKLIGELIDESKKYNNFPRKLYSISEFNRELNRFKYIFTVGKYYFDNFLYKINAEELNTLESFYNKNLSITETSADLFIHKNTVRYRLNLVYEKTGLNPFYFIDALHLYSGLLYGNNK